MPQNNSPLFLPDIKVDPPSLDELEISLFGPGRGECVVVHLGNNDWLVVDSCLDNTSSQPVALRYLENLGVDPREAVQRVVVTHWHDDHIKGISAVVEHCPSAYIYFSQALLKEEFFELLTAFYSFDARSGGKVADMIDFERPEGLTSGVSEIAKIVAHAYKHDSAKRYKRRIHYAGDSTIVFESVAPRVRIRSLSPSAKAVNSALVHFAGLVPDSVQRGVIPAQIKNHCSIALWIEFENIRMLLGGDLEQVNDPDMGWNAVLEGPNPVQGSKASVFKVPHHGSHNGHNDRVWKDLLEEDVNSILTPFYGSSNPPPTQNDLNRLLSLTDSVSITAQPKIPKKKYTDHVVQKLLSGMISERRTLVGKMGHIQIRAFDGRFSIGFDGPARQVDKRFMREFYSA